ncbi:MAG: N,N-dimethylformamidase [Proteobacteria bacterium]|nr:N,N-dimethylformamidase [Pseudomonadota bacterium]
MLKITGYSDQISVAPGEAIRFMVSCDGLKSYTARIVRILCGDDNPEGPGVRETVVKTPLKRSYPARKQTIHAGSCAVVESQPLLEDLESFSVQALIFPTTPTKGTQGIITKWSDRNKAGFGLVIDDQGSVALRLGDGEGNVEVIGVGKPLVSHEWYLAAASYDAKSRQVCVYQIPLVDYPSVADQGAVKRRSTIRRVGGNRAPLVFAGHYVRRSKEQFIAGGHYNGKIDRPRLASRALDEAEMHALFEGPIPPALRDAVVGSWDFSRDIPTEKITDTSGNRLHGETVNLPSRAIVGYNWTGDEMCWRHAPLEWGAIHFHDDDVYDAGWEADFELTIPANMRSGLYAAQLRSGDAEEYIPFVVKPKPGAEAKIAFILPTASYMAYGNEHMATDGWSVELLTHRATELHPHQIFLNEHREYGPSLYDVHSDGSSVYYSSRLRPLLNMRPKRQGVLGGSGSSLWQFNADTHIVDWLEAMGFDYDVLTDEDLHDEGVRVLRPYRAVLSGTHPEYISQEIYDTIYNYTRQGGRYMSLGANGFYGRIAYHRTKPGVIEIRWDYGPDAAAPGEWYCSFTGEYSGLWRRQARGAPQVVTGVGFSAEGFDVSSYYRRKPDSFNPRTDFIFKGVGKDELIGDFGLIGGGAAGLEIDRADRSLGTPPHALVLASSEGHTETYQLALEEIELNYPATGGTENDLVRADMVFYETPNGGAVFSTGSIAWAGSLSHNDYRNNVSRITANVLRRFISLKPFAPN